jgi:hypothetical protein
MTCHIGRGGVEVRLYFLISMLDEGGQRLSLATLEPQERPLYPLHRWLGGLRGPVCKGAEILSH